MQNQICVGWGQIDVLDPSHAKALKFNNHTKWPTQTVFNIMCLALHIETTNIARFVLLSFWFEHNLCGMNFNGIERDYKLFSCVTIPSSS